MPVGLAYGILMQTTGYNWIWTGLTSLFVFAGSLQFLMVTFLAGGTSLVIVALMAFLLNSRHIFYGIPFINKWKDYGPWKAFLIFALPDETFSLHCANVVDEENKKLKMFTYIFTAALDFFYWVAMSILGAVLGSFIHFDTSGIDFALTALFIVILIEQIMGCLKMESHRAKQTLKPAEEKKTSGKAALLLPALIALVSSIACLIIIGPDNFILPSLVITVVLLFIFRGKIEVAGK